MAANSPQFFKVFLPDQSSQRLLIPPSFVKKYLDIIPMKIDLKDSTGKLWNVDVEVVGKNLFMQNGWHDFVTHYSLEYGDFLVFTWSMTSTFDVKLFGRNGCLKNNVSSVIVVVDDISTPCTKVEDFDDVSACVKKEDKSTVVVQVNNEFPRACNRISTGLIDGPQSKRRRLDGISGEKVKTMLDKEEPFVRPNTPHFVVLMKKSYRSSMNIPLAPLKENGIKLTETVELRDHNDKLWPVKLNFRNDGRTHLSAGWPGFRNHMKLEKGDKCLFEFILEPGSICRELKVQAFYSNPKKQKLLGVKGERSLAMQGSL